jgi:hypothetical protein
MAQLAQQRCFNHALREAVARCPSCRRFYCRECVIEHGDRLMCAACIAAEATPSADQKRPWRWLSAVGQAMIGFIIVWIAFLLVGQILLDAPAKFHEGTVWQENWWESP